MLHVFHETCYLLPLNITKIVIVASLLPRSHVSGTPWVYVLVPVPFPVTFLTRPSSALNP